MFSLRHIFGDGNKIYDLLTASATEGLHSVEALTKMLASQNGSSNRDELASLHAKNKAVHEQLRQSISDADPGDFDRGETEELADALYKVPKTMEKFAARYSVSMPGLSAVNFGSQLKMLDEAIRLVVAMLTDLRKKRFATVNEQNGRLQKIEGDADKLMLSRLGELYSGKYDALTVIALRDLYELLEKTIDHCRDAGSTVSQLVLKHS